MSNFNMILGTLTACAAISLSTPALAGSAASSKLPKEVGQMHCMVGKWRGSVDANMGGKKVKLQVSLDCQESSGGFGVSCKSRFTGLPSGPVEETDLFGYNPQTGKYHWFAVTNMGETHDHVANVPTGPTVHWVYRGTQGGKPLLETVDFTFNKDSTRIRFSNTTKVGGATVFSMAGSVRKQ